LKAVIIVFAALMAGCGKSATPASDSAAGGNITDKLASMPPAEREAYARQHVQELIGSAHVPPGPGKRP